MPLIAVNSSAIAFVGYDGYTLRVIFHTSDKKYDHPGVPHSVYVEFMNAPSMGRFYAERIRGRF